MKDSINEAFGSIAIDNSEFDDIKDPKNIVYGQMGIYRLYLWKL